MAKLVWDAQGQKLFETGTKNCALYVMGANNTYEEGVAWNGITGVTVSNTGGDETALWADDTKYASLRAAEECGGTIEAYTYPEDFYPCDGIGTLGTGVTIGQQGRKSFGLAFVSTIGNDTDGLDHGYKIHVIYGATASPSERAYATINDSPDAITLSWEFTCTPVNCTGFKPVAHLEIDSTKVAEAKLTTLKNKLFGVDAGSGVEDSAPTLLLPDKIKEILDAA